ncbi:MAG: hypothetical protein HY899_02610 [Deltaproteobacteria bacterium]|nr:hypothetical protein [Deltaproteobacteria bacterium]
MDHTYVAVAIAAAAVIAAAIVATVVNRSRSLDEGLDRLRLGINIVLLGFYRALWAAALLLLVLGWYTQNFNYWYGAFGVLLIGLLLFRDLSASQARPLREWLSGRGLAERARAMEEETARLREQLRRGQGYDSSRSSGATDEEDFMAAFRRAAADAAHPQEKVDGDGKTTRTYTFQFRWPPRSRDA